MSLFVRYVPTGLSGGGGGSNPLTVGTIDSQTPSANALTIATNVLYAQSASGTAPGMVNLTTQTFLGQKTFTTGLTGTLTGAASLNVLTSALGNLTDAGTDGIVITGGTGAVVGSASLAQHVADTTHNGYLSSVDWNTFNGKQAAGNYITALTGDGTATGPGSVALTFATVNSNVGSFTPAAITVNAKGLVTAASNATTGNLTDAGTDGIVVTGGTGAVLGSGTSLAQTKSDATHNGYLSSVDWNTFNGKQATVTIGSFNGTSTANGLDITSNAIALHAADGTNPGAVSTTTQTFAGAKTFSADVTATSAATNGLHLNLTSTDTGGKNWQWISTGSANTGGAGQFALINITDSSSVYTLKFSAAGAATFAGAVTTGALTASSYVADMTVTGASTSGSSFYLNNTKSWRFISTGSANTGGAGQLGIVNATDDGANYKVVISAAGVVTFTNAPVLSALTASLPLQLDGSKNIVSTAIDLSGTQATGTLAAGRFPALTGDITTSAGALATTLATVNSNVGTFGDATHVGQFTVNAKGLITAASSVTLASAVIAPATIQKFTSGTSSTYNKNYTFVITSGSATVNATYTNNSITFTVYATVAGATQVVMSGSGAPSASGTLTKATGTGDSTLTFSQVLAPLYLRVLMVGAGGGGTGGGISTSGTPAGGTGGTSNWIVAGPTTLLSAAGGVGGGAFAAANGGIGGAATITAPAIGTGLSGGQGGSAGFTGSAVGATVGAYGGSGAASYFGSGGSGCGMNQATTGVAGVPPGSGGGGGGCSGNASNQWGGPGGGSGAFIDAIITSPAATYTYSVGVAGTAGNAGTNGTGAGAGAPGYIEVTEYYQ